MPQRLDAGPGTLRLVSTVYNHSCPVQVSRRSKNKQASFASMCKMGREMALYNVVS